MRILVFVNFTMSWAIFRDFAKGFEICGGIPGTVFEVAADLTRYTSGLGKEKCFAYAEAFLHALVHIGNHVRFSEVISSSLASYKVPGHS
jgi:hypothetical protein